MCKSCEEGFKEPYFDLSKMPWYEDKPTELTREQKLDHLISKLEEAKDLAQKLLDEKEADN